MSRPAKIQDPELLATLTDIKLTEQLSWPQLAERYTELTDETVDWKTIRRAIMKDAPLKMVPERISRQMKEAITQLWDSIDVMKLILYGVNARFTEWSLLNDQMLRATLDDVSSEDTEIKFTSMDQARMDFLWNDLQGFFFKALAMMKEMKTEETEVGRVLMRATMSSVQVTMEGDAQGVEGMTPTSLEQIFEMVSGQTQEAMDGINEHHRLEGRGHYRVLEAEEEDLLEENDGS